MANHSTRGRPAHAGERYACGKLKPAAPSVAPVEWARIRAEAAAGAHDPRLGTEIGRLSIHRELSDAQTVTAFRVGEIYSTFERYKGKGRSVRSPNYGGGGDSSVAEELLGAEALERLEDNIKAAHAEFIALADELKHYPTIARATLELLCVENRHIGWNLLPSMRMLLDRLAVFFANSKSAKKSKPVRAPVRPIAAVKPLPARPTRAVPASSTPVRIDAEKTALMALMTSLRPDLDAAGVNEKLEFFAAAKDRAAFNAGKAR